MQVSEPSPAEAADRLSRALDRAEAAATAAGMRAGRLERAARSALARIDRLLAENAEAPPVAERTDG